MLSRGIILKSRPEGTPKPDNFAVEETGLPSLQDGEVLVRNLCMSVDPYMRGRMMDVRSYVPPFQVGKLLEGGAIGEVVESNDSQYKPGDHVESMLGWREAFVSPAGALRKLEKLQQPPSAYLGVLGMPGMTAYAGLLEVGALKEGETVFVSAAAGAVGSLVGQIALQKKCRVIGSAGGPAKTRHLTEELGFHHAIDYRKGDLLKQLREVSGEGLDVYFDNVGGDHLEAAIFCMRPGGRIPLCGMISQYNAIEPPPGPKNLIMAVGMSLTLRGFIVTNFEHLRADFLRDMGTWIESGRVRYRETRLQGIESAPEAFMGLFSGQNLGKMVVDLA